MPVLPWPAHPQCVGFTQAPRNTLTTRRPNSAPLLQTLTSPLDWCMPPSANNGEMLTRCHGEPRSCSSAQARRRRRRLLLRRRPPCARLPDRHAVRRANLGGGEELLPEASDGRVSLPCEGHGRATPVLLPRWYRRAQVRHLL